MYKQIETERLFIRPINLSDTDFIFKLVNTKGWLTFIGNGKISTKEKATNYIQRILDSESFYYNVFELKETKEALGIITFLDRDEQEFPDIGFAILPNFEKKGYTYEACKAYLNELLKLNIYKKIIGITVSENKKSIALLNKIGLQHERDYIKNDEQLSIYSTTL